MVVTVLLAILVFVACWAWINVEDTLHHIRSTARRRIPPEIGDRYFDPSIAAKTDVSDIFE